MNTHVISPDGRQFKILAEGKGPKGEPVTQLERLDRRFREQGHVWRSSADVKTWIWIPVHNKPSYRQECRKAASGLTREVRQSFLDLLRTGKAFGEAREQLGISSEAALGILNATIQTLKTIDWTAR